VIVDSTNPLDETFSGLAIQGISGAARAGRGARHVAGLRACRSRRSPHEPRAREMAFLNIGLNATRGWSWRTAWQLVGPRS
jgi:hypothetical protein